MGQPSKEIKAAKQNNTKQPTTKLQNENSRMEAYKIWKSNNWIGLTVDWTLERKKKSMNSKYKIHT